jgi:adenosylmethionine---8-amino-7-oxononanoate aminotransferase
MALQYWRNRDRPSRHKFIAFRGGYHGDTTGAMAVSDPDSGLHEMFRGLLPAHHLADLPRDAEGLRRLGDHLGQHPGEYAGIIVEPLIQGAGGMLFHDAEMLRGLRRLADDYDVLLIFDEIFTGFGRTGTMFACEAAGVTPDIVTLSKALTGGTLPLAATIARTHVFDAFWSDDPMHALMHGPTYMGNALACAAANASLDLFEREPRLQQVRAISEQMTHELAPCRSLAGVKAVRVMGAVGVVELERIDDVNALRARFVEEGVFVRPFGNVIYLAPSFTIAPDELSMLTWAIVKVVGG